MPEKGDGVVLLLERSVSRIRADSSSMMTAVALVERVARTYNI